MTFYEMATIIVGIVSILVLALQVGLAARTLRLDHKRRKDEATIAFMVQIRPLWHQGRRILEKRWGEGALTEQALSEIDENPEAHEAVRTLLGHLELLSVGVNAGVYDLHLLNRMSGHHLCTIHDRLAPYVRKVQGKLPSAYVEFENVTKQIRRMRGQRGGARQLGTGDADKPRP